MLARYCSRVCMAKMALARPALIPPVSCCCWHRPCRAWRSTLYSRKRPVYCVLVTLFRSRAVGTGSTCIEIEALDPIGDGTDRQYVVGSGIRFGRITA